MLIDHAEFFADFWRISLLLSVKRDLDYSKRVNSVFIFFNEKFYVPLGHNFCFSAVLIITNNNTKKLHHIKLYFILRKRKMLVGGCSWNLFCKKLLFLRYSSTEFSDFWAKKFNLRRWFPRCTTIFNKQSSVKGAAENPFYIA